MKGDSQIIALVRLLCGIVLVVFFVTGSLTYPCGEARATEPSENPSKSADYVEILSSLLDKTKITLARQLTILQSGSRQLAENTFKIRNVSVSGLYHVPKEEITTRLVGVDGVWLWDLSRGDLSAKLAEHPWVQSAKVTVTIFPPRFNVQITEEQPYLVAEFGQGSWLVGRSGKLIAPLRDIKDPDIIMQSVSLPRLSGEISRVAGEPDRDQVRKSTAILRLYQSAGGFPYPLERAERAKDGSIKILSPDLIQPAIVIGETDFDGARRALEQLRLANQDLQARGESAKAFDLRFQGQVVIAPVEFRPDVAPKPRAVH